MSDQAIKIERNIPLVQKKHKYPIKRLNVGDSFAMPNSSKRSSLYSAALRFGYKITIRTVDDATLRVWRIA